MPELHKNYSKTTTVPTAILPCYVILHSGNWKTASMSTEKSKEAHQESQPVQINGLHYPSIGAI